MPRKSELKGTIVTKTDSISETSKPSKDKFSKMVTATQSMKRSQVDREGSDAQSVISQSKMSKSQSGLGIKPGMMRLQNTYQTEPIEGEEYDTKGLREVAEKVLNSVMEGVEYNPDTALMLSRTLSDMVRDQVKTLQMKRYKFVVSAVIGMKGGQGLKVTSRCIWNTVTDNFTSVRYENNSLFAVVMIHAVYMD